MRVIVRLGVLMLLAVLGACTTGTPGVSKIVVSSGVANNSFKVGDSPTLTAVAQDSSGNTLSEKTFTWISSNENIATVDSSGKLTPKQVGSVKIGAVSGGVRGEVTLTIYGLQVIGGVAKYIENQGANFFIVAYRLMLPGGGDVPAGTLTITGPTGFNFNQPRVLSYTSDVKNGIFEQVNILITAVKGDYKASTKVEDQTYEATFSIDPTKVLAFPTELKVASSSLSSLSGSWVAPADGKFYIAGIQGASGGTLLKYVTSTGTDATINDLALEAGKTYRFSVQAFSFQNFDQALPAQFNSAFNFVTFKP